MKKVLHVKRALRTVLLVLLLSVVGMTNVFADGYDYAEVCPSGQTLYYRIDPDDPNGVIVVPPYNYSFPDNYEFWGEGYERPAGDLVIPETLSNGLVVKKIGHFGSAGYRCVGAFQDCTELTSVTIGNSVTTVDDCSFYSCTNLTSVIVGNSVTSIGTGHEGQYRGAFEDCTNLTNIEFGNSVASIGTYAFKGCTSLTTLVLPNSLNKFEYSAFADCTNLSSITIPDAVMSISMNVFANTAWYNSQNDGILYLDTWCLGYKGEKPTGALDIREGTRGISWKAFDDCSDITSVTFPNSLVSIVEYAFCETGLTGNLTIPKSVAYIGGSAFEDTRLSSIYYNAEDAECNKAFGWCSNLATLIIGPDVRNLDGNAFKRCNTAHLVVALGATPAVLGSGAFSDLAENAMLMVPCGKKLTYFSQWNMFPYDNIIENCDQIPVSMGNISAGGSITASTSSAQLGEEVQLTINPDAGMALKSITICNTNDASQTIPYYFKGKSTKIYFVMPSFAVTINATFGQSGASVGENNSVEAPVYPNPTTGNVKVEASDLRHVSIFNAIGQQVYDGQADGNVFEYDLSNHEAGIYLIQIETISGIATKRVVLTK